MLETRPKRDPINVELLDPDKYILEHGSLPVTSHMIHAPNSTEFHPDGLFSEIIFDQIGNPNRLIKCAYLDLRTKIFQPIIYKNLLSLKSFYNDILAGRCNVIFDDKEKDFVRADVDNIKAGTGFSYFLQHFHKIQFKETGSFKRKDKISILKKYRDRLFIDRFIVLPAGLRDIRDSNGRLESEDINKIYLSILSMSKGLPIMNDEDGEELSPVYDGLRYSIQAKILELYEYIQNIVDGKKGYAQGKYGARNVALGSRNVVTSPPITEVSSPNDPRYFKSDDVLIPLYQASKDMTPLVTHMLRSLFFEQIFTQGARNISLIDPTTNSLRYYEIDDLQISKFMTDEGVEKLINLQANAFIREKPVTVQTVDKKLMYMYMVYDLGDTIYILRNAEEFSAFLGNEHLQSISPLAEKLQKLEAIGIGKTDFVVVGSGCMAVRGYPHVSEDLDIRVSLKALERIKTSGIFEQTERSLRYQNIEVYTNNDPSFEELLRQSDEIDGYRFLKLSEVYSTYKKQNRLKDRKKLQWLRLHCYDPSKLRSLTYGEMFYMATYAATQRKHGTTTRYPVLNTEGILVTNINLQTTTPNRIVHARMATSDVEMLLPRYPVLGAPYQESMCPHASTLAGFDGDFDGDVFTFIGLWSDEANTEIDKYRESPVSMVSTSGKLIRGLAEGAMVKFTFFTMGYMPPQSTKK